MNNENFRNHEQAMELIRTGKIRQGSSQEIEQRYQQFGGSMGNQGQQGSSSVQQSQGLQQQQQSGMGQAQQDTEFSAEVAQSSSQAQSTQGVQIPSQDVIIKEYMERYPKAYGQPIVAVRKEGRGRVVGFKLQNGQVLDYPQIIQASIDGALDGLVAQNNREGEIIVRSAPDAFGSNNLDNLPEF